MKNTIYETAEVIVHGDNEYPGGCVEIRLPADAPHQAVIYVSRQVAEDIGLAALFTTFVDADNEGLP